MSIYYLFSGFHKEKGFTSEIAHSLRKNIYSRYSLVFIASCPYDYEKTDFYKDINLNWFRNIGIEFDKVDVIDDRKTETECCEIIKNASAIFLCGGTTLLQIDFIRMNNLSSILRQFDGIIMGISAGAINMAEISFYSADKSCEQTHIYEGIGLVNVSVEPHFYIDNTDLLEKDILPFSEKIEIYAMSDNSAIVVYDDKREYHGDILSCIQSENNKN